jgi:serine/threonine-protein kinase
MSLAGRYALYAPLATGGMATVYLGRALGADGFSRVVAIKKLHEQFAAEPAFVSMLLDEARIVSRIRHPNVVQTLDVVRQGSDVLLVMEYVHGDALSSLMRESGPLPLPVVSAIMVDTLRGLHAAHQARAEGGELLHVVHRDVSPQNILVGEDGMARVIDFGIAKAAGRSQSTEDGAVKGKLAYMSPEQLRGESDDPRVDIWAAGVVLWELLEHRRLFQAEVKVAVVPMIMAGKVEKLTPGRAEIPALQAVLDRALALRPEARFASADEMARAIENAVPPASARDVASWLASVGSQGMARRADTLVALESGALPNAPTTQPSGDLPSSVSVVATSLSATTLQQQARARRRSALLGSLAAVALFIAGAFAATSAWSSDKRGHRVEQREPSQLVRRHAPAGPSSTTATPARVTSPLPSSGRAPALRLPVAASGSVGTRPAASATTGAAPATNCNPPYTLGPAPDYLRRPKPECL